MAVKAKIDLLEVETILNFASELTPEGRRRVFAAAARQEIELAKERNKMILGHPPRFKTYVDGRETTNLESVRPDGVIHAEFELFDDVFAWIADQLLWHSPVGKPSDERPGHPGMYRGSHVFFVDYEAFDPGQPLPARWNEAFFASTVPYARKIERGESDQTEPEGVYHAVARLANKRFGNLAKIKFSYRDLNFGAIDEWAAQTQMPSERVTDRDIWLRRQPAIIITPR